MAECICLKSCPFFNDKMPSEKGMGAIYKKKYCLGNNTNCARYMVFKALGKGKVPDNLYPNMHEQAKKLISEK
ncbi:MAG: hypothetical protein Kow0029_05120 [Candidatus Rifleibacteriota bacterium]